MVIKVDLDERLKSDNDEIFKQAFEELKDVYENLPKNARGTSIEGCHKYSFEIYQPRYKSLSNQDR